MAALGSRSIHPPQENKGQLQSSSDLSSNLPVKLAHQLTNLFHQFMPVTSQENETASHIGPPLQPVNANNCSINNQFQSLGDSAVTTTCQMPSSSLQLVLAIDQPAVANNLQLPRSNELLAADEVLSAASPMQPLS